MLIHGFPTHHSNKSNKLFTNKSLKIKFMKNSTLIFFLILISLSDLRSQNIRYIDEIFSTISIEENVVYGENATIAPVFFAGATKPVKRPLTLDIYSPDADTETARPVVILFHNGNFLPPQVNGGCEGTVKDNSMVVFANKLAKRGFVVAVADYRIGWNPIDPNQINRVNYLLNAAYRGVQDSRTCVRFLKKTVAEDSNPFGIDPNKITLWGFGTGGYITYASATLDAVSDTYIPKFLKSDGTPMIIEQVNGNVDATNVGILPLNSPPLSAGDTLCHPNHVEYSSEFQLGVSAGGSLGDTSWIDENDVPYISFHVVSDPYAPSGVGTVVVPPPANLPVVEVMGGKTTLPLINQYGLNDVFDKDYIDDISSAVGTASGNVAGFFPFYTSDSIEAAPWNFHASTNPYGLEDNPGCDTISATALVYVDSMLQYFAPRACLTLGLGCDLTNYVDVTSSVELTGEEVGLNIMPNPAQADVRFEAKENIEHIYIYDLAGRLIKARTEINYTNFILNRESLTNGIYIAQIRFKDGLVTEKLILN